MGCGHSVSDKGDHRLPQAAVSGSDHPEAQPKLGSAPTPGAALSCSLVLRWVHTRCFLRFTSSDNECFTIYGTRMGLCNDKVQSITVSNPQHLLT